MEYKDIYLKVIGKEMNNFEHELTKHSTFEFESTALFTENFDIPYNRCIFLSRYANSCLYLFKDSIEKFLLNCPDAKNIFYEWKSHAEVKVCSLSTGPGLDYFAFMLAVLKYDPVPPSFSGAKVISKYGAWQNTANFMLEVLREKGSVCGIPWSKFNYNIEVTQTDDLVKSFSEVTNVKNEYVLISNAHVVLMMRTLNLYAFGLQQEASILQMLKELLSSLRSDATVFCVDTIPSLVLFNQALSCFPGKFLYSPSHLACKIPVHISEGTRCCPETHFNGTFFVWRKLPYTFTKFTSLGMTPLNTNCERKKPTTAYGSNSFTADTSKQKIKYSEILPWRELPLCKIPWGKLFWQNASVTAKKSLRSVMSLKKESLERHWIGEVANLYMKEYGTPNFSIPSEETEKVLIETTEESSKESAQMVTEILAVCNALTTPHSVHIQNKVLSNGANTESMILEENSFDISPSSSSSGSHNAVTVYKPFECGLTIPEKDSFVEDSNKGEVPMSGALKQSIFNDDVNDTSIEMTPLNAKCETENENTIWKASVNSKTRFSIADNCNEALKSFEILPWRKLPHGEIPWGKIFWENASSIMKKSLQSLLSMKKEGIECHWIGEVINLYLIEFGALSVSKSSDSIDKNVSSKNSCENTFQSTLMSDILNILNTPSSNQSDHYLLDLNYHHSNTESTFLRENSFDAAPSTSSLDFHNKTCNFNYQPLKCDPTIKPTDSLVLDLKKEEIALSVGLKETSLANPTHLKTKTDENQNAHIDTIQTRVNRKESIRPAENEKTLQLPFETELTQTNSPEIIRKIHPSIEALTESIEQLMISVKRLTHQKKAHFHQSFNSCHHEIHSNTAEINSSSKHITCPANILSASRQNVSSSNNNLQNDGSAQCSFCHCRCHCCHNKYSMKSLHSCHYQACHCASTKQLACSENQPLVKSPNIVIPLRNVSDDVFLEILSILKTEYKSC